MPDEPDIDDMLQRGTMRKTRGQKVCIVLALLLLPIGLGAVLMSCCWMRRPLPRVPVLPHAPDQLAMPATIKVALTGAEKHLSADARHGGTWYARDADRLSPLQIGTDGPWELEAVADGLSVNGGVLSCSMVELRPAGDSFELGGHAFRGSLLVTAGSGGTLRAHNLLPPEQYMRSVVGSEMYHSWPLNALMAQAVCARTFVVYAVSTKGSLSRLDLAYKGIAGEGRAPDLAVELTRGIVLTYNGRILPAFFHSTCGGRTASAAKIFGEDPIPPLEGVPCDWCRQSSTYTWKAELKAADVAKSLKLAGVREIRTIEPQQTEPDGYARFVLINGRERMDANAFRLRVGPGAVKSTKFQVQRRGDRFVFEGHGFGHGAGLCQWGAFGMADAGRDWQQILGHYYPGAELQSLY